MMHEGWIKLHRKFLDWEWYDDTNTKVVFIHCLFKANFEDRQYQGKTIKRGQLITGRKKFAKEVGLSVQQVRTAWNKLEATGEITTESTNQGTTITVCNYSTYQNREKNNNQQVTSNPTNEQPASNQQVTTRKNEKNEKKESVGSSGTDFPKVCTHLDEAKTLAKFLLESIKEWDQGHKFHHNPPSKSAMYNWILEIERAMRIDGRTKRQLAYMINYLFNKDTEATRFWASHIQSGVGLREKFEKVKHDIKKETGALDKPKKMDAGSMTPAKLKNKGYLTQVEADKYSKKNFREPLKETESMFKIFTLNNEKYYKPLS